MVTATDLALLLHSDQDGVATLTLNRPAQYNALATEGIDAFLQKRPPRWRDGN